MFRQLDMKRPRLRGPAILACLTTVLLAGSSSLAVTGNPATDGWQMSGHSLENGLYAVGNANYGFNMYSKAITIATGSDLAIADGNYSWQEGDTVIGAGGLFSGITASEAGWSAFSGRSVNSLLTPPGTDPEYGPKLQVKLGTANATWSTSTVAPGSGNGSTGTGDGGDGTVHFRTSGWFHAYTPLSSQETDTTWSGNSGELMLLDKDDHIRRRYAGSYVYPDKRVARVIWEWNPSTELVVGWELLLNVSLLDRLDTSGNNWLTPGVGDPAIFSVQDRDSDYTDALTYTAPEPATIGILLVGLAMLRRRR